MEEQFRRFPNHLEHKFKLAKPLRSKYYAIAQLIIFGVFCGVILVVFFLQISNLPLMEALRLQKLIIRNLDLIDKAVIPQSTIAQERLRNIHLPQSAFVFKCLDMGLYYLPVRINPDTYNYEGVRRGNGDIWIIEKASSVDIAAAQFCNFVITEKKDNTIECGIEMFQSLGYSGYSNSEHWCVVSLSRFIENINRNL